MKNLSKSLTCALSALALIPGNAFAQQIEEAQKDVAAFFADGQTMMLVGWKGAPGEKGSWTMSRRIIGATNVRRCFTRFETVIVASSNVQPATTMGVDWADIRDVRTSGASVTFRADWLAADETLRFDTQNVREAAALSADFEYLIMVCKPAR